MNIDLRAGGVAASSNPLGAIIGYAPGLLREITWTRIGLLFLFVAICTALYGEVTFTTWREAYPRFFRNVLLTFTPVFFLVLMADAIPLKRAARIALLVSALALGSVASIPLRCALIPEMRMARNFFVNATPVCSGSTLSIISRTPVLLFVPFTLGGIILVVFLGRRREGELAAALREAEASQMASRRRRLDAELKGMQARVDPTFLLEALEAIRERSETDPQAGEILLDRLSDHLRAALPHVDEESSTLEREIRAANSWLEVHSLKEREPMRHQFVVAPTVGAASFPAMILTPLVGLLARSTLEGIHAEASVPAGALRIVLSGLGPFPQVDPDGLSNVRLRLTGIYGDAAVFRDPAFTAEGWTMILEVPHEPCERTDR